MTMRTIKTGDGRFAIAPLVRRDDETTVRETHHIVRRTLQTRARIG